MRCRNCGWENPDGATTCEKCHAALTETNQHNSTEANADRMRSTVSEAFVFNEGQGSNAPRTCPKCGYPVTDDSTTCPNCNCELVSAPTKVEVKRCKHCGNEIDSNAKFCPSCGAPTTETNSPRRIQRSTLGTVMGGPSVGLSQGNRFCTLKPIAWQGEDVPYTPVTYSGETIILNRANTDANNNSITSREQAVLTFEDGEWYIENRSDLRTTYIRVNGKTKLTSGDIIVLGNREFEFKG
jgi:RNA polymerase subunit RPABC4/transcription elongation factor Spt4